MFLPMTDRRQFSMYGTTSTTSTSSSVASSRPLLLPGTPISRPGARLLARVATTVLV